jgi:hypothetical protein
LSRAVPVYRELGFTGCGKTVFKGGPFKPTQGLNGPPTSCLGAAVDTTKVVPIQA